MHEYWRTLRQKVSSFRISLTNRCNLKCIYCHNEGEQGSGAEITVDEVARVLRIATKYGVDRVKFSGGEPLLRRDLEDILRALPPLRDVSLTTNGTLLAPRAKRLREAGLNRVNISLDSLDSGRFDRITRREGQFRHVMEGIDAAIDAGLTPVKLNMVYLKGVNEDEVEGMMDFSGRRLFEVIELMNRRRLRVPPSLRLERPSGRGRQCAGDAREQYRQGRRGGGGEAPSITGVLLNVPASPV